MTEQLHLLTPSLFSMSMTLFLLLGCAYIKELLEGLNRLTYDCSKHSIKLNFFDYYPLGSIEQCWEVLEWTPVSISSFTKQR